jgi:hypothetical protein
MLTRRDLFVAATAAGSLPLLGQSTHAAPLTNLRIAMTSADLPTVNSQRFGFLSSIFQAVNKPGAMSAVWLIWAKSQFTNPS